MVDPDVKDWERLRKEIPAVENKIDNAMAECHKDKWAESMTDEGFKAYCKGNVQKYLWRYEMKGKPAEDLKKAQWYLNKLIEVQDAED